MADAAHGNGNVFVSFMVLTMIMCHFIDEALNIQGMLPAKK